MTLFTGWLARGGRLRTALLRNTTILLLVTLHPVQLVPVLGQPWQKFDPEAGPEPIRWTSSTSSPAASGYAALPDWFTTNQYQI